MYRKIRITVASLVVIAMCVLSSVGTLSYFTDTDSATNNFVVGNASTKLAIYDDVTGDEYHVLDTSEYTVVTNGVLKNNTELPGIPFYLQATNDGNIPVYQRFRVVIPIELANVLTLKMNNCTLVVDNTDTDVSRCENANYSIVYNKSVDVENTPTYAEYYIVSKSELGVGAKTSEWPTAAIVVGNISNVENFDQIATCEDNDTNKCLFGVRAYSDVIQTTGFTSAIQAFENFTETY